MKFVFISFLVGLTIKINLINSMTLIGEMYLKEKIANNQLAEKYCDSLKKNLFKGLDKERILKYEYFFNSINTEESNEELEKLSNFPSEVEAICSYNLNDLELNSFREMIKEYLSKK